MPPAPPGPRASGRRSQRYYWTRLWQELEAEASEDVREGRVHRFEDPLDAIRWLLDEPDDVTRAQLSAHLERARRCL